MMVVGGLFTATQLDHWLHCEYLAVKESVGRFVLLLSSSSKKGTSCSKRWRAGRGLGAKSCSKGGQKSTGVSEHATVEMDSLEKENHATMTMDDAQVQVDVNQDTDSSPPTMNLSKRADTNTVDDTHPTVNPTPTPSPPVAADSSNVTEKHQIDEEESGLNIHYSITTGLLLVGITLLLLIPAAILRSSSSSSTSSSSSIPRPVEILGTFYFVGTIIFGGGAVVVPLLYSYVVVNGWLSIEEFLFGLAVINAMPGKYISLIHTFTRKTLYSYMRITFILLFFMHL